MPTTTQNPKSTSGKLEEVLTDLETLLPSTTEPEDMVPDSIAETELDSTGTNGSQSHQLPGTLSKVLLERVSHLCQSTRDHTSSDMLHQANKSNSTNGMAKDLSERQLPGSQSRLVADSFIIIS